MVFTVKGVIFTLILSVLAAGFTGCDGCSNRAESLSLEDQIINEYQKHMDDLRAEYDKLNMGDYSVMSNIKALNDIGSVLKEQMNDYEFTEAQKARIAEIEKNFMY